MRMNLRKEIGIALLVKTVAIFAIWWFYFSADELPESPAAHILSGPQGSFAPSSEGSK